MAPVGTVEADVQGTFNLLARQYKWYLLANIHLLTATLRSLLLPLRFKRNAWILSHHVRTRLGLWVWRLKDRPVCTAGSRGQSSGFHMSTWKWCLNTGCQCPAWPGSTLEYMWDATKRQRGGTWHPHSSKMRDQYREGPSHTSAPRQSPSKWVKAFNGLPRASVARRHLCIRIITRICIYMEQR